MIRWLAFSVGVIALWGQHVIGFAQNLDAHIDFNANQNPYIKRCLSSQSNSASQLVESYKRECIFRWRAIYELGIEQQQMVVGLRLLVNYEGLDSNKNQVKNRLHSTVPCLQDFFARHGLRLNLQLIWDRQLRANAIDEVVVVDRSPSASRAHRWAVLEERGYQLSSKDLCTGVAHEIGHLVGLSDTGPDYRCPNRPTSPFANIMRQGLGDPNNYQLSHKQIETILGPLCTKDRT